MNAIVGRIRMPDQTLSAPSGFRSIGEPAADAVERIVCGVVAGEWPTDHVDIDRERVRAASIARQRMVDDV